MRGQSELADGNYEVGMAALTDAVAAFRRAGDLSMGAFSLLLSVMYAIDREPTGQLIKRLSELEMVAWRQRNDAVVPALRGARLWVMVRAGQMTDVASVREITSAIVDGSNNDAYSTITSHAFCALALTAVGDSSGAVPLAVKGRALLEATFPRPPFLDVARVAEATALIADVASDLDAARRALKKLRARQHRVPGIRVATRMLSARLAIREGRIEHAREELASVVEDLPRHGESWWVHEAHHLLGRLLAGTDAPAARAHVELATDLASRLQIAADPPAELADETDPHGHPRARFARTTLNSLWNAVLPTLPPGLDLVMEDTPLVVVQGDPALLELLLVNLVLAARDMTPRDGRVEIESRYVHLTDESVKPPVGSGRWGCIQVRTDGATALARGALRECQSICADLGGFLEVGDSSGDVVIRAYVKAADSISPLSQQVAVVVHREELLRRSLVDALRRSGWTVVEMPVGETWPDDTAVALVDGRLGNAAVQSSNATVVRVISRADETPPGPYLRVPYLVKELDDLLGRLKRAPTVPGSQSG
jgi:signal transduction histidine kinase